MQFYDCKYTFVTLKAKKEQQKSQKGNNCNEGSAIIGPPILSADKGVQNKYMKISESGKKILSQNVAVMPKNDFLKFPRVTK